jgi:hypothetical protein
MLSECLHVLDLVVEEFMSTVYSRSVFVITFSKIIYAKIINAIPYSLR